MVKYRCFVWTPTQIVTAVSPKALSVEAKLLLHDTVYMIKLLNRPIFFYDKETCCCQTGKK